MKTLFFFVVSVTLFALSLMFLNECARASRMIYYLGISFFAKSVAIERCVTNVYQHLVCALDWCTMNGLELRIHSSFRATPNANGIRAIVPRVHLECLQVSTSFDKFAPECMQINADK